MHWVTIIWTTDAAVCFTLAVVHLLIWLKKRDEWGHLLFSCSAIGASVVCATDLA